MTTLTDRRWLKFFERYGEADDHGSFNFLTGLQFVFGSESGLSVRFQVRETPDSSGRNRLQKLLRRLVLQLDVDNVSLNAVDPE